MPEIRIVDVHDHDVVKTLVSEQFGLWGPKIHIDKKEVQRFAEASGDFNPLHLDDEIAATGPFGQAVAHGGLIVQKLPLLRPKPVFQLTGVGDPVRMRSVQEYVAPVPVGSWVRARERVKQVRCAEMLNKKAWMLMIAYEVEVVEGSIALAGTELLAYTTLD
jgi:acyl dehydratase